MLYISYEFGKRITDMRLEQVLREAKASRLLREAGIVRRGSVPWSGRWLLCHLGCLLVRAGRWLEKHSIPQTAPLEGQMTSGR